MTLPLHCEGRHGATYASAHIEMAKEKAYQIVAPPRTMRRHQSKALPFWHPFTHRPAHELPATETVTAAARHRRLAISEDFMNEVLQPLRHHLRSSGHSLVTATCRTQLVIVKHEGYYRFGSDKKIRATVAERIR